MSQGPAEEQGFFKRRVPLKWVFVAVSILVIIMAAVLVAVLLIDRNRDDARRAAAVAATSSTVVTSPYDFSELPADTDLGAIENAAFVSILIPDEEGDLTSYGISSDLPAAQALSEAIRDAGEVDPDTAASVTATIGDAAAAGGVATSTITFVFPDRGTLTFILYLDLGLVARGEHAWRPAGDLRALVEAAVIGNQ